MTNLYHTPAREEGYFFHVDGTELPAELREVLIKQSKLDTAPSWEGDDPTRDVIEQWQTRDLDHVNSVRHIIRTTPANEGIDLIWNGQEPEIRTLYNLIHPEAKKHLSYIILSRCAPNGFMSPHIDYQIYNEPRKAVMFLPLTPYSGEDWAPLTFYPPEGGTLSVGWSPCYVADTERVHGIENNDKYRASVSIAFACGVETLYTLYTKGMLMS